MTFEQMVANAIQGMGANNQGAMIWATLATAQATQNLADAQREANRIAANNYSGARDV